MLCVQIISDVWWKIEIDMHANAHAVAAWKEMHTLCVIANKCLTIAVSPSPMEIKHQRYLDICINRGINNNLN
mgnify:CR=1 FL=1